MFNIAKHMCINCCQFATLFHQNFNTLQLYSTIFSIKLSSIVKPSFSNFWICIHFVHLVLVLPILHMSVWLFNSIKLLAKSPQIFKNLRCTTKVMLWITNIQLISTPEKHIIIYMLLAKLRFHKSNTQDADKSQEET